jgi:peptide subunit release factor RF-3
LLFVFILNTIVVFACSLGMDMKFNSNHHHEKTASSVSHHHESDVEHHEKKASNAPSHHQENQVNHHENDKDNCCKDEAVKFAKYDKLNSQASHTEINPIFFPALLTNFYNLNILESGSNIYINKFVVLRHHPPIRDIRIAIQSFQI